MAAVVATVRHTYSAERKCTPARTSTHSASMVHACSTRAGPCDEPTRWHGGWGWGVLLQFKEGASVCLALFRPLIVGLHFDGTIIHAHTNTPFTALASLFSWQTSQTSHLPATCRTTPQTRCTKLSAGEYHWQSPSRRGALVSGSCTTTRHTHPSGLENPDVQNAALIALPHVMLSSLESLIGLTLLSFV